MRVAALGRLGLGTLAPQQVEFGNRILDEVSAELAQLRHTLDDARQAGMPESVLSSIEGAYATALQRFQALTERLQFLSDAAFQEWLSDANQLTADIRAEQSSVGGQLQTTGASGVRINIAIATALTIGAVGVGLFWLWNKRK